MELTQTLLEKKAELIEQIEKNFSMVDRLDVQKKIGMSKRMMNYHLYHTKHHAQNMGALEKIVQAQVELMKEKTARADVLLETAKTVTET